MWKPVLLISTMLILLFFASCAKQKNKEVAIQKTSETTDNSICLESSSTLICWSASDNSQNPEDEIKKVLTNLRIDYENLNSQQWNPKDSTFGGIRDYKLSKVATAGASWNCILLHLSSQLGEKISLELSKESIVITFLEFDQVAWGYSLFQNGKLIDQFCNNPEEIEKDPSTLNGNTDVICQLFNADKSKIEPYLKHADNNINPNKAFSEDEFTLDDHWVRVDFMKKLGLIYPDEGTRFYIVEKGLNDL